MMKKLLLMGAALFALNFSALAQCPAKDTVMVDTLHYYFNKFYFKTGSTTYSAFPTYKSAASTVTNITHCGSRFDNADPNLRVTGLVAYASKGNLVNFSDVIPVHLYLCYLGSNGLPVWPPIDSVITDVTGGSVATPSLIGGDFKDSVGNKKSYVIPGNYAVLFRNMSTASGDTVKLVRTNGATFTNTASTPQQRISDGKYGFVRYSGNIYTTQNFTTFPGFGYGTDYEFMVAPLVQYTLSALHKLDQRVVDFNSGAVTDTICHRTDLIFQNLSSYHFNSRFFNLIEFYRKWNTFSPFASNVANAFTADSAGISWKFEFYEPPITLEPRRFLPYQDIGVNHGTISVATSQVGYFNTNEFRARLKPMSAFARGKFYRFDCPFDVSFKMCNNDAIGLKDLSSLDLVNLYPNPLVDGVTNISGLQGSNTIKVFDVLGQLVLQFTTDRPEAKVDLQTQSGGTYMVSIRNSENVSRVVKVIKQE